MDPVRTKLREARSHLDRLGQIESMKEFYPTLNAFLAAARSVLSVARHEIGWKDRLALQRTGFTTVQEAERKHFDTWFEASQYAKAVLDHPLTTERNNVIHRGGQAGFVHVPKPIGGLAMTEGSAHGPGLVARGGRMTLPLEDRNIFYYDDPHGAKHDAVDYCRNYFRLVEVFFIEVDRGAWR